MCKKTTTMKKQTSIKIEVGSGNNPRQGYLSCDIRDLPNVDYVTKADELPFGNGTVDELYSRHVIEHFTLKEFLKTLQEWNRVLSKSGVIYIICPNLNWHLNQILKGNHNSLYEKSSGKNDRFWGFGSLFGWQQDEYDIHKFGYYFELLRDILIEFGFSEIENLTNSKLGIECEPWHLEVKGKKTSESIDYKKSKLYNHFNVKH